MTPITMKPESFKDPRANILYGKGNTSITDDQIRDFISNAKSDEEIMRGALQYNVSADQVSRAMGGQPTGQNRFDKQNITNYLDTQGISRDKDPAQTIDLAQLPPPQQVNRPSPVVASPVVAAPVKLNEQTDTVQGRLNSLLADPNSPLLQRAGTMAAQASNRRGLLNTSIGVSAGQAALTDAALQIATPDAQARTQAALQNSELSTRASSENAKNNLTAGMFNNDLGFKVDSFNSEMGFKAGAFNAEQVNAIMGKHLDNNNRLQLAEIEAKYQRDLQGSASASKLFSDVMQLITQVSTSDLPEDSKQKNVDNLISMLEMGLSLNNSFAGMGLDQAFTPSGGSSPSTATGGGILNQLSGGQINPSGSLSGNTGKITVPEDAKSAITGQKLGATATGEGFNTIGGTIPKPVADSIEQAYGVNPKYVALEEQILDMIIKEVSPYSTASMTLQEKLQIWGTKAEQVYREKVQPLIDSGKVKAYSMRDAKTAFPLSRTFWDYAMNMNSNGMILYDPDNALGLMSS
jgi:hypothetical protein